MKKLSYSHYIVLPRYLVVAVFVIVVALIGGMGWFTFNYGQMTAQRDHLAMQLSQYSSGLQPRKPQLNQPSPTLSGTEDFARKRLKTAYVWLKLQKL